jgi:hypothetical protein
MYQLRLLILLTMIIGANCCKGQDKDSTHDKWYDKSQHQLLTYTVSSFADTSLSSIKAALISLTVKLNNDLKSIQTSMKQKLGNIKGQKMDSVLKSLLPVSNPNKIKDNPFLKFNGGAISYNMNYRSNIDTPFAEKNILQHNAYGNINFSVMNIPLVMNFLIRRSNSTIFRDINDLQLEFNPIQLANNLQVRLKEKVLGSLAGLKDNLSYLNYKNNLDEFKSVGDWFSTPKILQKLTEYSEILNVPGITIDSKLTDSANGARAVELKRAAQLFIEEYAKRKEEFKKVKGIADSLENLYTKVYAKIQTIKNLTASNSMEVWLQQLKSLGIENIPEIKKYQRLLNVQKFGLGRNQLNYSELTSKNMSLTGVNFEYNSWYYAAFAGGKIDYRFRDFIINTNNRKPQFMIMARLGIGKINSNHLIFSFYRGQKQLFAVTNNTSSPSAINISGFAAEAKYFITPNISINAEVAESLSPDFRNTPATVTKLNLTDRSNKAVALKVHAYLPATHTRFVATYKYTGANFQSFRSFQTNSSLKTWYIKADQQLFKRKLKLAFSLRTNEFSNPYIIQNYKSNTLFKSIQATYRAKQFPIITVGFQPTSQITAIDNQLVENQFYSFNMGVTHTYKIGVKKASSVLVYNQFYNNENDTGFLYYNATNLFLNQTFYFDLYNMNVTVSHSKSTSFELNVLDAGLQFKIANATSVGFGVKINDFDKTVSKTGAYGSLQFFIKKLGMINMVYDNGFIPGNNHRFVKNELFNLNFTKFF